MRRTSSTATLAVAPDMGDGDGLSGESSQADGNAYELATALARSAVKPGSLAS